MMRKTPLGRVLGLGSEPTASEFLRLSEPVPKGTNEDSPLILVVPDPPNASK